MRDNVPPMRSSFKGPFPPGPRSWLPLGMLPRMQRDPLNLLTDSARKYGDVVHFMFGPQHVYLLNHPDFIREVLVAQGRSFMKGRALQRAKILLGEGLLTSEFELHQRQRRLAQPAFHRERIAGYGQVMIEQAERRADTWHEGATLDIAQEMMQLTLAVVAQTLFGVDVSSEASEIGAALTQLMEIFPTLVSPFSDLLRRLPLPSIKRTERAIARLDQTIYRIIAEHRSAGVDRGDLLSLLMLAQDEEGTGSMDDRQLRDEAMTIFLAGHETTANALAWTWMLLAQNPDVAAALQREVDSLGRSPEPGDMVRLPLTEAVFAESMRLFPPAWTVGRLALEDVSIGKWLIPRGAIVILSQWVTHHDPRWWPEPERFDPSRFTPEAKARRPKFAYFPFGGGTRICVGEGFAWMEGVLILATLARRWSMSMAGSKPVKARAAITLRPHGGLPMTVSAR